MRKEFEHQTRRCSCGGNMPHRYSFDFVRGLFRAQCICERCGRKTEAKYAHKQHVAITAAYAASKTYASLID